MEDSILWISFSKVVTDNFSQHQLMKYNTNFFKYSRLRLHGTMGKATQAETLNLWHAFLYAYIESQ